MTWMLSDEVNAKLSDGNYHSIGQMAPCLDCPEHLFRCANCKCIYHNIESLISCANYHLEEKSVN